MAQIADSGGGGGTASSICAISPSDLVGTIGNLITRIEQLEFQLSQIVGANLHTEALSNLSQQVGWVYNVEYMGVPGWTQTEYGTLIPPAGFTLLGSGITLSDGNTYSAVQMDADGVLQYGFQTDGTISGAQAGGAYRDYYMYAVGADTDPIPVQHKQGRGVTLTDESDMSVVFADHPLNSITLRIDTSGVYLLSIYATGDFSSTTGSPVYYMLLGADVVSTGGHEQFNPDLQPFEPGPTEVTQVTGTWTGMVRANAGDTVILQAHVGWTGVGTVAYRYLEAFRGSIIQVSSL